ncbi:MAG: hypothetical protein H6551_01300 [Chitinophagales bacterium]|nr:hypothetical protein [Chitinophagales bacterium]
MLVVQVPCTCMDTILQPKPQFNNNKVTMKTTGSTVYIYTGYAYNINHETNNNTFDITSTSTLYWYNQYAYSDNGEFNNNKVTVNNGSTNYYY